MGTENEVLLAKDINRLAGATDDAVTLLARAILELADSDSDDIGVTLRTRAALERLAESKEQ